MAKAAWSQAAQGTAATSSRNQVLADLKADAVTYNDPNTGYNDIEVYYNGYNPLATTPEGVTNATWAKETE